MLTYNPNIFLTYKCQILEIIAEPEAGHAGRVLENAKYDKEGDPKGYSNSEQNTQQKNQLLARSLVIIILPGLVSPAEILANNSRQR